MKNLTNKQIYKRIKNKRITGTVILFLVVAVIAWFAAYYSVKYFFRYIGDSKLAAGKNTAKTMGEIYDEGVEEKDEKKIMKTVLKNCSKFEPDCEIEL